MNDADFHRISEATLSRMQDLLEEADTGGELDVEYQSGVLTIMLDSGQTFVVSKHTPSRQVWLSSPLSGGLHFPYDTVSGRWILADGRELHALLAQELLMLAHLKVEW